MVWVLVGAGIATVVSKVYGVVRSPGGVQGWVRRPQDHVVRKILCCCHIAPSMPNVSVWLSMRKYVLNLSRL